MSQSRKAIRDYSAIYLDGLRLDTNSAGNLTLAGQEIGTGGGGSVGDHLALQTATVGNLIVPVNEGNPSYINDSGLASFTELYVNNFATFGNLAVGNIEGVVASINDNGLASFRELYVDNSATLGSLTIGTVEGTVATISDTGIITCSHITPGVFAPQLALATQGTSITTGVTGNYSQFGSVLTVSTNLPTQGSASFSITNAFINSNSKIISNIVNYIGTGLPSVYVSSASTGIFNMTLQNNSISDPLNGTVEIGYMALLQ